MEVIGEKTEKLIIFDMFESTLDNFKDSYIHNGSSIHPKWAGGYLLYFTVPQDTDYVQKREIEEKTITWNYLEYVKMPKYEWKLKNIKNNCEILVHNMDKNPFFEDVVKFIRDKDQKKPNA